MSRAIVHLDADAFFASVEQAADSRLRGRPVAVGGERRGVIASASYEARRFGVAGAMPTARARKLCPQLIVLPGDFEKYERFSRWMFGYAYDFTPDVEVASIDEGYFDLTATPKPAVQVAGIIRDAVRAALKITVSEGIGANKLVSQIASKLHKPAAFEEVPAGGETTFLHPLPHRWLPGVGPQTALRLQAAGLVAIGELAATPLDLLELLLGSQARTLRQFAHGIDERPVVPVRDPAKSFGQQQTFPEDVTDEEYVEAVLRRMADELFAKVRAEGRSVRTLTVKVRYNDHAEDQAGESLREPTDLETDVYGRLHGLLRQAWKRRVSLRMVSLRLTQLYAGVFRVELPLDRGLIQYQARERLARVVDELRETHGTAVLLRGHDFRLRTPPVEAGRSEPVKYRVPLHRRPAPPRNPIPLNVHSHYTFLDSTWSPAEVVGLAAQHGLPAVALTDTGNLHGAVEFVQAAQAAGIKPVLGAEVRVGDQPLLLYVASAAGYQNLCRLLSRGSVGLSETADVRGCTKGRRAGDTTPYPERTGMSALPDPDASVAAGQRRPFRREELRPFTEGLLAVSADPAFAALFPGRFYQAVTGPGTTAAFPGVFAPRVHYATPADRMKYDIVQSIRTRTLLRQTHPEKRATGTLHLRTAADVPAWCRAEHLDHARELVDRCEFVFPFGRPQFPPFHPPGGGDPRACFRQLVFQGLADRYGAQADRHRAQVEQELAMIHEVGYEEYFLVVWGLLQDCRRAGIDWITRGSAADSLVCYCLRISDVCPVRFDLYFRRFLNRERMAMHKLPDIDLDFPHDRKDDVVDLIFAQHGAEHCAVVGGFNTFQARAAVGDVAKVLGVSEYQVRRFTEHFPWSGATNLRETLRQTLECRDLPLDEEPYRTTLDVAGFLDGRPRHPKMHPCGVVLSRDPMCALTPTFRSNKGYPTTHLDMDAVEAVGLVKLDILAQGGLSVMRDTVRTLRERGVEVDLAQCRVIGARTFLSAPPLDAPPGAGGPECPRSFEWGAHAPSRAVFGAPAENPVGAAGQSASGDGSVPSPGNEAVTLPPVPPLGACDGCKSGQECPRSFGEGLAELHAPPADFAYADPEVWEMIAGGGARSVHHIESPAMTGLCRMTNVREIDGLVAIVSVIRPGAANEQKKLRFTRRYQGFEPVTYPHPSLEAALRSTFGLVVYEEHILQICESFAGLNPGRADVLRRALNKQKAKVIAEIQREFVVSAARRGHAPEKIAEVWELVAGFAGYAFCKAHSTAYGVEAYQAAWLKRHFPAEFLAAVLTHGKGFYDPLVYVLEARRLGVGFRAPSVNAPGPAFIVEGADAGGAHAPASRGCGSALAENSVGAPGQSASGDGSMPSPGMRGRVPANPGAGRLPGPAVIRVPLTRLKGLGDRTRDRLLAERARGAFASLPDFFHRVRPLAEELEAMIRVGAFDEFGTARTAQFWEAQHLLRRFGGREDPGQGWLIPPPGLERLPGVALREPGAQERLEAETELLGFAASGHPLDLFPDVAWETYCPIGRLGGFVGDEVVTCGLVVEQRTHHQVTGEPMKFLTLADWTGMVETELFAATYRSYGLATVRYPVLEITARVEPFENGRGFTLRVLRAAKPRTRRRPAAPASRPPVNAGASRPPPTSVAGPPCRSA